MASEDENFDDEHAISRKDFLQRSLAAGVFFNLNFHPLTKYPIRQLSDIDQPKKLTKSSQNKPAYWHGKVRKLRYHPEGADFVIENGSERFNRALYGNNHTAFRVETGDIPEFALYMPGLGGTIKLGLQRKNRSKWLNDAGNITARYRPGARIYKIQDPLLGEGSLQVKVLAMADAEGILLRCEAKDLPHHQIELVWAFGGASDDHFSRGGDMGVNPRSDFALLPEHCKGNLFKLKDHSFDLLYGKNNSKKLSGIFDPGSEIYIADAGQQGSPADFIHSAKSQTPALAGRIQLNSGQSTFLNIYNPETYGPPNYAAVPHLFEQAENARKKLAHRVQVETPDAFVNPVGGALNIAADAIWQPPSYLHGAVAWRRRYNGWRGPYVGDPLGWHKRSRMHFSSYAKSQLTKPDSGPVVPDPAEHLAREKMKIGTAVYTKGYICHVPGGHFSADHYDMNMCTIDALLWHFRWRGNWSYIKKMWPVIKRHLAWEKRCFDGNSDGLYDAYACIWASDSLEYNGGGVTHSSAYNYRANEWAAYIAQRIGKDPEPYRKEAEKIYQAVNEKLWMPKIGRYAEFQDLLGMKKNHKNPGLWTIYHAIDSGIADAFKSWQLLRYVDTEIPHIPVRAEGLQDENLNVISTTSWRPYTYSVNNVAMAEILNTALAYWQAGRIEKAFRLWKSAIIDNMYAGISPANFAMTSFYDAMNGERYRDFGDPIGIAARTMVEGLFGIVPDAMKGELLIRPGLPREWKHASLDTPDISYRYRSKGKKDRYIIKPNFQKNLDLRFKVHARKSKVKQLTVNGKKVSWEKVKKSVGQPALEVHIGPQSKYEIQIEWAGDDLEKIESPQVMAKGNYLTLRSDKAKMLDTHDPQQVLDNVKIDNHKLSGRISDNEGHRTFFVKLRQDAFSWWAPVCFEVRPAVEVISATQKEGNVRFSIKNNTAAQINGEYSVSNGLTKSTRKISLGAHHEASVGAVENGILAGTNRVEIALDDGARINESVINWNLKCPANLPFNTVDLSRHFNDRVVNIYQNEYEEPRPPYPTYQLPIQGLGNWTSPFAQANIDDSGLRKLAGSGDRFELPQGIPFRTPGGKKANNVIFTSQWDHYPQEVAIPLSGSASHAYFLMAGSTNPMQSRFENGRVIVDYNDGSSENLKLVNPETWWPIEQDYYIDNYVFALNVPKPIRVHLKTGLITRHFEDYVSIKRLTDYAIDGGAATVLDLPLDASKKLKSVRLKAMANEVVIGMMSMTLVRT